MDEFTTLITKNLSEKDIVEFIEFFNKLPKESLLKDYFGLTLGQFDYIYRKYKEKEN